MILNSFSAAIIPALYLTFVIFLFYMVVKTLHYVIRYLKVKTELLQRELEKERNEDTE
jgi:hypothetical protein